MRIPFVQVDAFSDTPFAGNPAAVMPLDAWLDDATLLAIAQENNLSETAFLLPDASGAADFELRWFTPTAEVALCGHATLASGHFILSSDLARDRVRFRTRQAGVLEVARADDGYRMALPAWPATPQPLDATVASLGIAHADATLFRAGGYAVVVLPNEAAVRALVPDFRAMAALGPWLVIATAPGDATDVASRVFVPAFGIDEDPVTGAAHAVITPYWTARLGRDRFTAVQASARGGRLTCALTGTGEAQRVVLTGRCVTVIEGSFLLA